MTEPEFNRPFPPRFNANRFDLDPLLQRADDLDPMADYLINQRAELFETAGSPQGGLVLAEALSDLADAVLRRIVAVSCRRVGRACHLDALPVAVIATGGYGRRELCPFSDIDITFVPKREGDVPTDALIREMFSLMMKVFVDRAKLEVGYAYRLFSDCSQLDHKTSSGLLDARLIAGSERLMIQFEDEFWNNFNTPEFVFTKLEERRLNRQKHGNLTGLVEPHLKEGAGGFRDLQTAIWLLQACSHYHSGRIRGARAWNLLKEEGRLTEYEVEELQTAKDFLIRVRSALHVEAKAERDQLVVTRQEEVAHRLGFADVEENGSVTPGVETMMRVLYGHLDTVRSATDAVLRLVQRRRMELGIGLDCENGEIVPSEIGPPLNDPSWMLLSGEVAQRFDLEMGPAISRALKQAASTALANDCSADCGASFTRVLASDRPVYPVLQAWANTGVLGWFLPEFGSMMGQIPYDPSHDYTIGQHTLVLIRNLDELRLPTAPIELRFLSESFGELPNREQLYLAAILHDAGKGYDERPHSESGAEIARTVCGRLKWSKEATDNVAFLIQNHLVMSETSRLLDMRLEQTIRDFAAIVLTPERLRMLALLTYADTRAVGEGIWTEVNRISLMELMNRTDHALATEEGPVDDGERLRLMKRRFMREMAADNLPAEEVEQHIEAMPPTYLLNTPMDDIAMHVGMIRKAREGTPMVVFHDERSMALTEVTVCAPDDPQPGLLSRIAGVFYAADAQVHTAQVFTRRFGEIGDGPEIAIDNFLVDFRGRQLTPGKRKEIETNLTEVLSGKNPVVKILEKRKLNVEIGGEVLRLSVMRPPGSEFNIIRVEASDSRRMLYRISGALSAAQLDIHSARVSPFSGHHVVVFYVGDSRHRNPTELTRELSLVMPSAKGR